MDFAKNWNKDSVENKIKNKIFEFVYGCALHDAILQLAFKGEKKWIYQVNGAKNELKKYIDIIIFENGFSSQKAHDDAFLIAAKNICDAVNEYSDKPSDVKTVFSFGNAQKLINMTVKHFYALCYMNLALRENFKYCHCPMDGIMLQWVWKKYMNFEKQNKINRREELGKAFCEPWGNETVQNNDFPNRYKKFQEIIRKWAAKGGYSPIEFDYIIWKSKSLRGKG